MYGKALGGMYQPNTRHQGLVTAELEFPNELPTEVKVQFEGVFFAEDGNYYADNFFIEYNPVTFTEQ